MYASMAQPSARIVTRKRPPHGLAIAERMCFVCVIVSETVQAWAPRGSPFCFSRFGSPVRPARAPVQAPAQAPLDVSDCLVVKAVAASDLAERLELDAALDACPEAAPEGS